tara:strand:+ start:445 stop:618 length:174 start_codon:yes stop_codon:yes gene_type:complete
MNLLQDLVDEKVFQSFLIPTVITQRAITRTGANNIIARLNEEACKDSGWLEPQKEKE